MYGYSPPSYYWEKNKRVNFHLVTWMDDNKISECKKGKNKL